MRKHFRKQQMKELWLDQHIEQQPDRLVQNTGSDNSADAESRQPEGPEDTIKFIFTVDLLK
jgi:hypothetical protein